MSKPVVLRAAAWVVALLVMGVLIQQVRHEASTRTSQFCSLIVSVHHDRVLRLQHTEEYLDTPAGEEATALNQYIMKISLPQTIAEVRKEKEQIPDTCKDER